MARIAAILSRFGLFAQNSGAPDAFDLRLTRIGTREARVKRKPSGLFRSSPSHPAGATPS